MRVLACPIHTMESTHPHLTTRGFTLVEMLVVLAIMGVLTAVVVNGQTDFNKSTRVVDAAYTVALSVRQAQTYGLSSRTYGGLNNAGYGVHFTSAAPKQYFIFADIANGPGNSGSPQAIGCPPKTGQVDDKPGNCLYDQANEIVQNFTFDRGFSVSKICGRVLSSGAFVCSPTLSVLDLVFIRPNTDTVITGVISGTYTQLKDASIEISDPSGVSTRRVCVSYAGQVSVSASACP